MNKFNPILIVALILFVGFITFKLMSFFGCYIRIENFDKCLKLTDW